MWWLLSAKSSPATLRIVSDPTVSDMTVKRLKAAKTYIADNDDDESDNETEE